MPIYWFYAGSFFSALTLFALYRERKRRLRRCVNCGSKDIERVPKMHPQKNIPPAKTVAMRRWRHRLKKESLEPWYTYMFHRCRYCGDVVLAKQGPKLFRESQIKRRRRKEPRTFECGPQLENLLLLAHEKHLPPAKPVFPKPSLPDKIIRLEGLRHRRLKQ